MIAQPVVAISYWTPGQPDDRFGPTDNASGIVTLFVPSGTTIDFPDADGIDRCPATF